MKKIFSYIGILVLVVAFSAPVVSAQTPKTPTPIDTTKPITIATPDQNSAAVTTAIQQNPQLATGPKALSPQKLDTGNWLTDYLATALAWIAYLVLQIVSLILALTGKLLNFVLDYTVVNMAQHINDMTGINIGWKVIRDLMNIVFIFLLVYEGIKLIIGLDGNAKKLVQGVILASLLVNFSLFFTKVLIDASNIVTIGFYNSIIGPDGASQGVGLSDSFQKALGLAKAFDAKSVDGFKAGAGNTMEGILIVGVMGSILFIIEACIFFAISIMFIVRYIVLILLMTLSPIGYFGMAGIPGVKDWSNKWWTSLNGQLLFGPIYMIMTWIILTLMSSPAFTTIIESQAKWSALATGDAQAINQSIGLLLNYVLIIGLSIASVIIAKGQATKGAEQIGDFTGKLTAFAGGAVTGGTAAILRNSVGRVANNRANDQGLKDRAASGDRSAQLQLAASRRLAESTFDVRRSSIGEQVQKSTKINLGKGLPFNDKAGTGGYKKKTEEAVEKEKKYSDSLKATPEEVERINAELASKEFNDKENEARGKVFGDGSDRKAKLDADLKAQNDLKNEADRNTEEAKRKQTEINTEIADSDKKIKDLELKIKNTGNLAEQSRLKKELEDQKTSGTNLAEQLKAQEAIATSQAKIKAEAQKRTEQLNTEFKIESERWMSKEKEALIRQKGGQRQETKKIDGVEYVTKDEILSTTQNYAETLSAKADKGEELARTLGSISAMVGGVAGSTTIAGTGAGIVTGGVIGRKLASLVYGNTKTNRAAAAKIRGGRKQKSIEDTLKELVAADSKAKDEQNPKEPANTEEKKEEKQTT